MNRINERNRINVFNAKISTKSYSSSDKSSKRNSSVSSSASTNGFFSEKDYPQTIHSCLNNSAPAHGGPS